MTHGHGVPKRVDGNDRMDRPDQNPVTEPPSGQGEAGGECKARLRTVLGQGDTAGRVAAELNHECVRALALGPHFPGKSGMSTTNM